jgi:large subunit ribosomal protein L31
MKKDIHPKDYRQVIFHDNSNNVDFLIASTIKTGDVAKWHDGVEYPLVSVEISSASHPFYTNQDKMLDAAGRVEKFKARQAKATPKKKS